MTDPTQQRGALRDAMDRAAQQGVDAKAIMEGVLDRAEAAEAEVERLKVERDRYREALRHLGWGDTLNAREIARSALSGGEE